MEQTEVLPRKQARYLSQLGKTNGKALEAPWEDIKAAISAGISFAKVAKQFAEYHPKGWRALSELMRKRAQREGWIVPASAIAKSLDHLEAKGYDVPKLSEMHVPTPRDPQKVGTLMSQTLEEIGSEGSMIAAQLALNQLRDAQDKPSQLAPLVDVKDLGAAMKVVRTAAGMDRQASPVSFNLFGGPMSQPVPRDITGDIRDESGVNLGEWSDE